MSALPDGPARNGRWPRRERFALGALLLAALLLLPSAAAAPPRTASTAARVDGLTPAGGPHGAAPFSPRVRGTAPILPPAGDAAGSALSERSAPSIPPGAPRAAGAPPNLTLTGSEVLNVSTNLSVGNLIVEGSAQFDFGNSSWTATLTIDGSVWLTDHARVDVWDAYVVVNSAYSLERNVYLYDNSTFELDDALVSSSGDSFSTYLYDDANLTVLSSVLGSWTVLTLSGSSSLDAYDSQVYADLETEGRSRLFLEDCAYGTVWTILGAGVSANLSLPAPGTEATWSFPARGTTGVDYTIRLIDSWPTYYGVWLFDGASVTVHDTSGAIVAIESYNGSIRASGLRQTLYESDTFQTSSISLHLENVSVASWSLYADQSTLALSDSQLGEVMGWSNSTVSITGSDLTGTGGFYATFDTSRMSITGGTIDSRVTAYGTSSITVTNASIVDASSSSVLAVGNSTVELVNDTLGAGVGYEVQDSARLDIVSSLAVSVSRLSGGGPALGAVLVARWASNLTVSAGPTATENGVGELELLSEVVRANGSTSSGPYLVQATDGGWAGQLEGSVDGPTAWSIVAVPLVTSTVPVNGSADIALDATLAVRFAFAMDPNATASAVRLTPSAAVRLNWSMDDTELSVSPLPAWSTSTGYTLSIGSGAQTADAIALSEPYTLTFATQAAPAAVSVLSFSPSNGRTGVLLETPVRVNFSVPMNASSTDAAISVEPATAGTALWVTASSFQWSANSRFAAGTSYTVRIDSSAASADGRPLAGAVTFSFTTMAADLLPRVTGWIPSNGSVETGPVANVTIAWSVPMDAATTSLAFSITPPVDGTVRVAGSELVWTADAPLPTNTTYLVEVAGSARSALGEILFAPVWSSFELRAASSQPGTPSPTVPSPGSTAIDIVALALGISGWVAAAAIVWRRPERSSGTARRPDPPAKPGDFPSVRP
jgi:hypothetical protein